MSSFLYTIAKTFHFHLALFFLVLYILMEFFFKYIIHNQDNNAFTDGTKIALYRNLRMYQIYVFFPEHCRIEITLLACLNIVILMH